MRIRNAVIIALFAAFWILPTNGCPGEPASDAEPRAILPESEYNFGKVVEDTPVRHEFILKNQGKGPLQIIKIEAG